MTKRLIIQFHDPSYTSWTLYENGSPIPNPEGFKPSRLLTGDSIDYNEVGGQWALVHSPIRSGKVITGVIVLEGGKTYGLSSGISSSSNKEKGKGSSKPLWKCIPIMSDLPPFLIPYDSGPVVFSKVVRNRFISFRMTDWKKGEKNPTGVCLATFGPVSDLGAYSDYWLTGHGLFPRPKLTLNDSLPLSDTVLTDTNPNIITLDPLGTIIFDDALSIWNNSDFRFVDIYITLVSEPLQEQGLWDSWALGKGLPTNLYLGDRRISMFPSIWTSHHSLEKNRSSRVIRLRIQYSMVTGAYVSHQFSLETIHVSKNLNYGTSQVDPFWVFWTRTQAAPDGWIDCNNYEMDQRQMVAFWMTEFNRLCQLELNHGFWTLSKKGKNHLWNSLQEDLIGGTHDSQIVYKELDLNDSPSGSPCGFFKMTSPLRRRFDIWNQDLLVSKLLGKGVPAWVDTVKSDLHDWCLKSGACIHLQHTIDLLRWVDEHDKNLLTGKIMESDGGEVWVYFPEIRWSSWIPCPSTEPLIPNSESIFRIYYFENEYSSQKKVRVEWIGNKSKELLVSL